MTVIISYHHNNERESRKNTIKHRMLILESGEKLKLKILELMEVKFSSNHANILDYSAE